MVMVEMEMLTWLVFDKFKKFLVFWDVGVAREFKY
jgi:hypothetical protein